MELWHLEGCQVSRSGQRLMTYISGPESQIDLKYGGKHRIVIINQHTKFHQHRRQSCKFHPLWLIWHGVRSKISSLQNCLALKKVTLLSMLWKWIYGLWCTWSSILVCELTHICVSQKFWTGRNIILHKDLHLACLPTTARIELWSVASSKTGMLTKFMYSTPDKLYAVCIEVSCNWLHQLLLYHPWE